MRANDCVCGSVAGPCMTRDGLYAVCCTKCGRIGEKSPNVDVAVLKWNNLREADYK